MKNKGFTLIELLAVIIILGILMIIAIPSVTKYISDSRKSAYIDTAKELIGSARNIVNSGKFEMYDTNTTYYIDVACIKSENATKSPYGDFVQDGAYVVVTYDGKGYTYYWTSVDDAGQGIKDIVRFDKLDLDKIDSDLSPSDITTTRGIDGREYTVLIRNDSTTGNCTKNGANPATSQVSGGSSGGTSSLNIVCKKATSLHKKTCENANVGCAMKVGNGNEITYGTIPNGSPKAGDAYDCDVNNDGTYDSATERFYYVTSNENNSTLIYYTNVNGQAGYAYATQVDAQAFGTCSSTSGCNWVGPVTGYQYLPSITEWSNPGLIAPGTRQILNNLGTTITTNFYNGTQYTIQEFTYLNKAARFLTSQELVDSCSSISSVGYSNTGELNDCIWLLENIGKFESNNGTTGYWLETPQQNLHQKSYYVNGVFSYVINAYVNDEYNVRPVITVKTSDIEQ